MNYDNQRSNLIFNTLIKIFIILIILIILIIISLILIF